MVFQASSFFGIGQRSTKHRPLLNEYIFNKSHDHKATYGLGTKLEQKKKFWAWFKSRPELNSPVSIRVNDTITERDFYNIDGTTVGRNKRLELERFERHNFMDERLKSVWFDAVVTGSGFGWKGNIKNSLNEKEYVAKFKEISKIFSGSLQSKELETALFLKAMDEDLRKPRKFDYVPSSTVIVDHDEYDVTRYLQYVGTQSEPFNPEEIIHFPFMSVDGRVDGYTPIESLYTELLLLWFIKENMVSYIRNGGVPNKIFVLPEEMANSENHEYLTEQLMNHGVVENRHGHLVLTGKVDVVELEEKIKDMEYKDLALYVTSNIAYALQIPVSRIPYMIGKSQSNGDAGGLADSGYWSMIDADQKKIENRLNTQLYEKFGVITKFRRKYKIDDLRETQALTMKADAIQKTQMIFQRYGKQLSAKKITTMMDFNIDDIEEIPKNELIQNEQTGLMGQNQLNNNQVMMEPDKLKKNDTKRSAAENSSKVGGL